MVANVLMFGGVALLLVLIGLWGVRSAGKLSAVDGWDETSQEHRRGGLRRGGFTCIALGVLFFAFALASVFMTPAR